MVRIILYIVMSKDGFIADESGSVDWLLSPNANDDYGYQTFYQSVDALMMGSKTYERFVTYGDWPYLDKKTYVFSHRPLTSKYQNIIFIADDANVLVDKLREENVQNELIVDETITQNIWLVGGAKLITSFYNQGLIDEYMVTIIPKEINKGIMLPKVIREGVGFLEQNTQFFPDGVIQKHFINV